MIPNPILDSAGDWADLPASHHNGACGFSFADGHSEIHKWLYPSTRLRVATTGSFIESPYPLSASVDNEWIERHGRILALPPRVAGHFPAPEP